VRINEQYLAKQYKLAVKKANVSASSGGPFAGHFFFTLNPNVYERTRFAALFLLPLMHSLYNVV
jgi:hypothetical protein